MSVTPYRNLEERIIANTVLSSDTHLNGDPCWIWIGGQKGNGYGCLNIRRGGKHTTLCAHRAAYEELVGPIPDGYQIDHLCGVTLCCNPNHLEAVPGAENLRRRDERRRA